uniref:Uncharacterized protein n=1 Tax=Amphimedon queenslandica TaxID=400682 RepID=A0A1X7TNJ3_AMPQE
MACQFYSFKVFADDIHDIDRSTLPLSQAEFRSSCCSNSESSINTITVGHVINYHPHKLLLSFDFTVQRSLLFSL